MCSRAAVNIVNILGQETQSRLLDIMASSIAKTYNYEYAICSNRIITTKNQIIYATL